jgi:hypothetical protein
MDTIPDETGRVYLIHFDRRINDGHPCRHYLGYTGNLATRIQEHQVGGAHAARLMQVAKERGIPWRIARVWVGGRALERQLKDRHDSPRICPLCNAAVRPGLFELSAAQIADELIPF